MALDKQTQHKVTALDGTWETPGHAPCGLWMLLVTRATARSAHLGFKAAQCLVVFFHKGSSQLPGTTGKAVALRAVVQLRAELSTAHWPHVVLTT